MIGRFIFGPRGAIRWRRLVPLLAVALVLAMFGPVLLALIPRLTTSDLWRGTLAWVAVAALKVPLVLLLFTFIRRNREWPGQPVVWDEREIADILAAVDRQAAAIEDGARGAETRLAHLSREAWVVADRLTGPAKVDALTVALRIDERLIALRARGRSE